MATLGWFEVMATDVDTSQAFYRDVCGWQFEEMMPGYGRVKGEDGAVGAKQGDTTWLTFYVNVDDLDGALSKAAEHGSEVVMPRTELPDVFIAVVRDPDGHTLGLAQAK